jgi:sugar transferase (PEP-CTERM system associated)
MPRVFRHYISYDLLALMGIDAAGVLLSAFVGAPFSSIGYEFVSPGAVLPKAALVMLSVVAMIHFWQLYDLQRTYGRRELLLRLLLALIPAYLMIAVAGYLASYLRLGRGAFVLSFAFSLAALFGIHTAFQALTGSRRRRRRLLLLGSGRPAQVIAETVNGANPNYELIGCLDGQGERVGQQTNGMNVLGTVEELAGVSKLVRPDIIVVALTERRQALPLPEILECKFQGVEVEDWPNFYEKLTGKILLKDLRPSWLIFSDGFGKNSLMMAAKRAMDVAVAVLGLALSLPLFVLVAFLIKIESRGPVFYRQDRLGQGGRVFSLIKFRSMREDAERHTGPVWAQESDPRVTRIGQILRKLRIDELPQLINVLRGEMSMVGPRPERPVFVQELQEKIPFYIYRLAIKPGITGWAQVKYRYGSTLEDASEKLQYDLYYIKNLSLFLDLLIMFQTVQVVSFAKGSR